MLHGSDSSADPEAADRDDGAYPEPQPEPEPESVALSTLVEHERFGGVGSPAAEASDDSDSDGEHSQLLSTSTKKLTRSSLTESGAMLDHTAESPGDLKTSTVLADPRSTTLPAEGTPQSQTDASMKDDVKRLLAVGSSAMNAAFNAGLALATGGLSH